MKIKKIAVLLGFCFGLGLLLEGCSLFNPHVGPSITTVESRIGTNYCSSDYSVNDSIRYAYEVYQAYYNAVQNHSKLNSASGIVITGLGGAAAAGGVAGLPSKTILGLGAGAGGIYAGTTFIHSNPRQYVYLAGMDALLCSLDVTLPFNLSPEEMLLLKNADTADLSSLKLAISDATSVAGELQAQLHKSEIETNEIFKLLLKISNSSEELSQNIEKLEQIKAGLSKTNQVLASITQTLDTGNQSMNGASSIKSLALSLPAHLVDSKIEATALIEDLGYGITNANNTVAAGPAILNDASTLYGRCQMAGKNLFERVNKIRVEVSRDILRTEPDISAFASQLGISMPKLVNSTGSLPNSGGVPKTSGATAAKAGDGSKTTPASGKIFLPSVAVSEIELNTVTNTINSLADKLNLDSGRLRQALVPLAETVSKLDMTVQKATAAKTSLYAKWGSLNSQLNQVQKLVTRVNANIGSMKLPDCVVNVETENILIFPTSPITAQAKDTLQIQVQGGRPPYVINWPVTNSFIQTTTKIESGGGKANNNNFVISVGILDKVPTNTTHTFLINDLDGNEKAVVIQIK